MDDDVIPIIFEGEPNRQRGQLGHIVAPSLTAQPRSSLMGQGASYIGHNGPDANCDPMAGPGGVPGWGVQPSWR